MSNVLPVPHHVGRVGCTLALGRPVGTHHIHVQAQLCLRERGGEVSKARGEVGDGLGQGRGAVLGSGSGWALVAAQ